MRLLTISSLWRRNKKTPFIRLQGNWLAENGFKVGATISVSVEDGIITIKAN
jgi:hypothetical protein